MSGLPNDIATGGAAGADAAQRSSRALIGAAREQDPRSRIRPDSVSCINAAQSPHSSKFVLPFARPSQTAAGLLRGPFKGFVTGHCQPSAIADRSRRAIANSELF